MRDLKSYDGEYEYTKLVEAIVLQALKDYEKKRYPIRPTGEDATMYMLEEWQNNVSRVRSWKLQIRNFFKSKYFESISDMNPEIILKGLDRIDEADPYPLVAVCN